MQVVKKKLSADYDEIEILPLSDWHIGDIFCDMKLIKSQIDYILNHDNAYCVLNGDLANNATKTSISDSYAEKFTPDEQLDIIVNLLKPIKEKILAITAGNHEKRTYKKEGIDLTRLIAKELDLLDCYSKSGVFIFLNFGRNKSHGSDKYTVQQNYRIYLTHGSGGGRKEGAKAIRLADMAAIVDADVYIHSHTHLPMILKEDFYRADNNNKTIEKVTKLFVNTASALDFGGYPEEYEFKPATKHSPIIYLDGKKKRADARL